MKNVASIVLGASLLAAPALAQSIRPSAVKSSPLSITRQQNGNARSTSEKLFLSVAVNGSAITADDLSNETDAGGGITLELGYGFTRNFALFLEGSAASISPGDGDPYILGHGDLGARFTFANPGSAFSPFLEAAFSVRSATQENITLVDDGGGVHSGDLEISGTGFSLGAGLNYFFNPRWALTTGFKWTTGEFSTVKFGSVSIDNIELDATTTRLSLGFSWYPRG